MTASAAQTWVGLLGTVTAAILGLFKYFNYKTKKDQKAAVGLAFSSTIDALSSDNATRCMAAAVLLRRFFDPRAEQGGAGAPYARETIEVIAGLLREAQPENLQKVLADSLRYARPGRHLPRGLAGADLQRCNLRNAYLGTREQERPVDLSGADLFEADCTGASLRGVVAEGVVLYRARLEGATLVGANLARADLRAAKLTGARLAGALIEGARFDGAEDIPRNVAVLLSDGSVGRPGAVVSSEESP
ncbi:pentapeptide repeat-containing protein [Geodermatophilus sp. SYSU D00779]